MAFASRLIRVLERIEAGALVTLLATMILLAVVQIAKVQAFGVTH